MKKVWTALHRSKTMPSMESENDFPINPVKRSEKPEARRAFRAGMESLVRFRISIVQTFHMERVCIACDMIGAIRMMKTEGNMKSTTGNRIFTGASLAMVSAREKRLFRS